MTETALDRALELAPIIERVHGSHHPELTRVRELTEQLGSAAGSGADTAPLFAELRTVTNDYAIPDDVCETFVATYESLQQVEAEAAA